MKVVVLSGSALGTGLGAGFGRPQPAAFVFRLYSNPSFQKLQEVLTNSFQMAVLLNSCPLLRTAILLFYARQNAIKSGRIFGENYEKMPLI